MATDSLFKSGDPVILVNEKFGFVRAWIREDYERVSGGLATCLVSVNSQNMPGIGDMTINTNQWDIYKADDPALLKLLINEYIPLWISR